VSTLPLIAVVGRRSAKAQGVRTEAVAVGRRYLDALRRSGAIGAVLAPDELSSALPEILGRFDGLVLAGGGDIDPDRYGDIAVEQVRGVDPVHDDAELAATAAALELGLPLLAICRGAQVLNVALGGTLHQHLPQPSDDLWRPDSVAHGGHLHETAVAAGSRLAGALGTTRPVCASFHHQALAQLGAGLHVVARADDGVVEGVELEGSGAWVVGVQWHPEDTAASDAQQQRLFDTFVAEAAVVSSQRR
jgi:putative glutamine amidotransferase